MLLPKTPWTRNFCLFVILYLTALLYCWTFFYRDPGSRFYDESRAFEKRYSNYRENEVIDYIRSLNGSHPPPSVKATADARICATFVSVKRDGADYLPLALASAVAGLSRLEREDLYLNALIAHVRQTTHPITQMRWPFDIADNLANYDLPQYQLDYLQELEDSKTFSEKAVIDYTYALRKCLDTKAEWIALFEDDIILADGWFSHTLQGVLDITSAQSETTNDWLFMRLFNQERSTGWSSREIGGNHELLISLAIAIPVFCALMVTRRVSKLARRQLDTRSALVICCIAIPAFVVLFFQAGKASLLPPAPGIHDEPFGCCSQGLVFPRQQMTRVIEYLSERKSGQIDLMLDDFANEQDLRRYAYYPVQLQHIGTRSARNTVVREAQAVWSMAFEQQNPKKLASKHASLVRSLYGKGSS